MQAPPPPMTGGGPRPGVLEEGRYMISLFLLILLILLIVYTPRIPDAWFQRMRNPVWQFVGVILVFGISDVFGWTYGILAALAFALILSHSYALARAPIVIPTGRTKEGFQVYPYLVDTNGCGKDTRWLSERILGENPFLIREIPVATSAVQDDSEKNMNSSRSSK